MVAFSKITCLKLLNMNIIFYIFNSQKLIFSNKFKQIFTFYGHFYLYKAMFFKVFIIFWVNI